MKVELLPQAREEVHEAFSYYENSQRGIGAEFLQAFEIAIEEIREGPLSWKRVGRGYRQHNLQRFPYGVVYQVEKDLALIMAVIHLKRRPGYWRSRI